MIYAQIINGIVVNTIVADADFVATQIDKDYVLCSRGGIGWSFDGINFIAPQPYSSWILDANYDWQPPIPMPEGDYYWNEAQLEWIRK